MPVCAVIAGGSPHVSAGSTSACWARRWGLAMPGLHVGALVGDDGAARDLRAGARPWSARTRAGSAAARRRRRRRRSAGTGRPGRRPAAPPWRCPSPSRRRSRPRRRSRRREQRLGRRSTSSTVGSPGAFSNVVAPGTAASASATAGTRSARPSSITTSGRSAPSSASTAGRSAETPSPNRILTGRWLRKVAATARHLWRIGYLLAPVQEVPCPESRFVVGAERADRLRVRRQPAVHRDRRPLRRRDASAPGRVLLPAGARGAKPRHDDGAVPARRR